MQILKFFVGVILGLGVLFGGYKFLAMRSKPSSQVSPIVTITGRISAVGPAVSIATGSGQAVELNSRKIDFSQYNGKTVTVVGQYSGSVLYVDSIR